MKEIFSGSKGSKLQKKSANNEQKYRFLFTDDDKLKQAARELKRECAKDVKSIRECAECFQNWVNDREGYFVKVCSKLHVLVLAKYDNFPYWPAKVMSVLGDKVNVEFFGDHTRADVPEKNCYLYRKPKFSKDPSFNEAVVVSFMLSF